ncbi:MAG TPA: hypothetical protein ENH50_09670 [Nitrospirae bacterium]|nr:hypothetical protein BMS3Abin08_00995 [bacterium BMS3Abin08]HDY71920.1 hypothetical protein [Nitrospirota bacterium]
MAKHKSAGLRSSEIKAGIPLMTLLLILVFSSAALAWHRDHPVTPYGDFCPECSSYGMCKVMLSPEKAEKAIRNYYEHKGFNVEIDGVRGRFIRATIRNDDEVVDKIIFDRKTGRIRSIY